VGGVTEGAAGAGERRGLGSGVRRPIHELRFVVVGAYVADCFVNTPRLPVWGETYQARSIRTSPGGKALNQAVALARLGAQVTAVGAVGDDGLGRDILAALRREGVDVGGVEVRAGVASAICVCFVGDDGETSFVWRVGDDVAVTPETVRAAARAIEHADAVLVTFELPAESVREAIDAASRCQARVFVQPAPPLDDPMGAASLPWGRVDVVVPNEAEARALLDARGLGQDRVSDRLAEVLARELGVPTVVVTHGEAGCVTHAGGATRRYPAERAAAVDSTGAFTATFAAYLTAGASEGDAVHASQSAAVWAIRQRGSHESMPWWS
jgi:ribokinase